MKTNFDFQSFAPRISGECHASSMSRPWRTNVNRLLPNPSIAQMPLIDLWPPLMSSPRSFYLLPLSLFISTEKNCVTLKPGNQRFWEIPKLLGTFWSIQICKFAHLSFLYYWNRLFSSISSSMLHQCGVIGYSKKHLWWVLSYVVFLTCLCGVW